MTPKSIETQWLEYAASLRRGEEIVLLPSRDVYYRAWLDALTSFKALGDEESDELAYHFHCEVLLAEAEMYQG